jgi:ketosteroid isomerase-like protein
MLLLVTASLLLAACGTAAPAAPSLEPTAAPPVPTAPPDPITIAQSFYAAFNEKDLEKARSMIAEDYVLNVPYGTFERAAAIIEWQAQIDSGITFNQTNFVHTGNGRVTSCYEVFQNGSMIDKGCGAVTRIRDGEIVYDGLEPGEHVWVVQKYYEALNAKNVDLAMSYIANDAVFINPTGTYEGANAIRDSLAGLNKDGITFELGNFRKTARGVVYDYKVMQGSNLLDQGTNGLTIVENGLVVFDGTEDTFVAE